MDWAPYMKYVKKAIAAVVGGTIVFALHKWGVDLTGFEEGTVNALMGLVIAVTGVTTYKLTNGPDPKTVDPAA